MNSAVATRVLLCAIVSLLITSVVLGVLLAIGEGQIKFGAMIVLSLAVALNALIPTVLSCFIFYFLVKMKKAETSTRTIVLISIQYILWSAFGLVVWALLETLFSGAITLENFQAIYRSEFMGWNLLVVMNGIIIPFLYFDKKFLRKLSGKNVAETNVPKES